MMLCTNGTAYPDIPVSGPLLQEEALQIAKGIDADT